MWRASSIVSSFEWLHVAWWVETPFQLKLHHCLETPSEGRNNEDILNAQWIQKFLLDVSSFSVEIY